MTAAIPSLGTPGERKEKRNLSPAITPTRLDLKRDERLEIDFADGRKCVYPVALLRSMCPCAACKQQREEQARRPKTSLNILPGNYAGAITVVHAELVGNYALRIDWSDDHGTGIYSFQYLRDICPSAVPKQT
jgi:DUF971 family protein